ncbi:MAG: DEAD/DEAH box helicase [Oscillospiraceae bacterium]|nr:DEAD/DEAH box helicase [Oscillospiraceae bacterium]
MNLEQLMRGFKRDDELMVNITCWREVPEREAVYKDIPDRLDARLAGALAQRGVHKLYSHQASAIDAILDGEDVVIVTPTASGKTLCYNLPVIDAVLKDHSARAMFLFPTKALSYDQSNELDQLINQAGAPVKAYTYDGDTPQSARKAIRQAGNIIVTNPDMLHGAILPNHTKWTRLFEDLKYIVIDELHHYGGVFGCHLANVLRRLQRICAFYGANPQYICCSATIANPFELAFRITGREMRVIDNNGAPSGKKYIVFYNPPVVNKELGIRRSSLLEARRLASLLLKNDISTIVFTRSRLNVEVLTTYLKEAMDEAILPGRKSGKRAGDRVRGYRGGYLPTLRREIEQGLRDGSVRGVVSTNALELGIDIGSLEACVVCGYPGSIASLWQQAGRAGRRQSASAVFLMGTSSPLDQYIIKNPEYFFGKNPEHGLINPDNFVILGNHIKCAAYELPFSDGEKFGVETTEEILDYMEDARLVRHVNGRWHWMADVFPAADVSLRSASNENFIIVDITETNPVVIGEIDRFGAPMLLHEEAIYIHEAKQYQVEKLDFDDKKAYVRKVEVDYYTDANLNVEVAVLDVSRESAMIDGAGGVAGGAVESQNAGVVKKGSGEVRVTAIVTLFKKIKLNTHENIGSGPVNLPELEMHTTAYWFCLPFHTGDAENPDPALTAQLTLMRGARLQDSLIGLTNILANVAPIYLMCGKSDIRVMYQTRSPFTLLPTVFIYDNYPGGVGFSEKLYELHDELFDMAARMIESCECEFGCPSCVGPAGEFSGTGNPRADTLEMIRYLQGPAPR